ncbi:MAG: PleD family two-component system response regulator, partial [Thermoanaerobaculia bacterium]
MADPARLLVVDDNEMNRDLLSRRLRQEGHAVETAVNGREALERIRSETFDLVLLDVMMPEMDGYQVLENLRAEQWLPRLPVIMISAVSELDSVVRCIELGATDYLPKPFNAVLLKA